MKTTTILQATEEALNQHNCWMDAYRKNSENRELLRMGEKRARQHSRLYAALLSRIDAGDRAREEVFMALQAAQAFFDAGMEYKAERDRAMEALKQVEWVQASWVVNGIKYCPFCEEYERYGHSSDCPRQLALGISNGTE